MRPDGVRIVRIATPGSTPGGCADCADRRAGLDPRRVCGSCGSPRRASPPKGVRIVRIATPGSTPGGCADCADRRAGLDPRRVVRIVRIATPGSTLEGCADCADRRAGFDPRRVCGSCGSPRRARPPEGVRIVRIATPGSTPEGCADCADRCAGLDPRRVCGSCGSPRRARPPKGVRIVRIATPGSTLEGCADCADRRAGFDPRRVCGLCGSPRRARPSKGVRIVRIAAPGSTPGECADCADRRAGFDPRRVCGSCGSPRRRSSHGTGRFSPSRNFPLDSPHNRSYIVLEPERDDESGSEVGNGVGEGGERVAGGGERIEVGIAPLGHELGAGQGDVAAEDSQGDVGLGDGGPGEPRPRLEPVELGEARRRLILAAVDPGPFDVPVGAASRPPVSPLSAVLVSDAGVIELMELFSPAGVSSGLSISIRVVRLSVTGSFSTVFLTLNPLFFTCFRRLILVSSSLSLNSRRISQYVAPPGRA